MELINPVMFILFSSAITTMFYWLGFMSAKMAQEVYVFETVLNLQPENPEVCEHCSGKGTLGGSSYVYETCSMCKGAGFKREF